MTENYQQKTIRLVRENYKDLVSFLSAYRVQAKDVSVYGYVLEDTTGASSDLNLLVTLQLEDKYKMYDWEDVDRKKLENHLTNLLGIAVQVDTERTLERNLFWYNQRTILIEAIKNISLPLSNFV